MFYFDCNVAVGKSWGRPARELWRTEDIVQEIEHYGINAALVYHQLSRAYAPIYGNMRLLEELPKSPRLYGCWTVLPHQCGDFPKPAEIVAEMKAHNIVAAKLFPRFHHFLADERTIGELCSTLAANRFPLLVDVTEIDFRDLARILSVYKELNVILQGTDWGQMRYLFPLMDEFSNLHIEFSKLQANELIEVMVGKYGAERLLFGSGMPMQSPGGARAFIDYARLSTDDKQLIAGGNLERLLNVKLDVSQPAPPADEIAAAARCGRPLDILVIDSHTHLLEDGGSCGWHEPMLKGDIDAMVAAYQAIGIDGMTVAPWIGLYGDTEAANHITLAAMKRYPSIVTGYVTINPNYTKDVGAEARYWHLTQGFKGMKPYYFATGILYNDPAYTPWWELANELFLFALLDPGGMSHNQFVSVIEDLAGKYPNVSLFMDHAGRSYEAAEIYVRSVKKFNNIYLQLTYTNVTLGIIEYLVDEVGAEKILFGTDSPMRDPRPQLGWLAHANISVPAKKAIFGENMKGILDRCLIGKVKVLPANI